jgi:hypothetical protein
MRNDSISHRNAAPSLGTIWGKESGFIGQGNAEIFADFPDQDVIDFSMTGNGGVFIEACIKPPGVASTLSEELAPLLAQIFQEFRSFHTVIFSSWKPHPAALNASCRFISKASCNVTLKLAISSSRDLSWQFTPGTSSIHPIHQSPSFLRMAVYSDCILNLLPCCSNHIMPQS